MADERKDTIYIDVEDEITAIIDKVRSSKEKIVALVLPKRATVLKSIVNMKLLKRTADAASKKVVLITSESGLLPLAGAVGLHVAKTLQSKPSVPAAPALASAATDEETVVPLDGSKSIGELAGIPEDSADETIEVNNDDTSDDGKGKAAAKAGKKNKKLKVPDFNKFRNRLFLGLGLLLLLIIGFVLANNVLPKARIIIKTDTNTLNKEVTFTASPGAKTFNKDTPVIPAKSEEVRKTENEKVPATGQKDIGTKATGSVDLKNCAKTDGAINIPAGTAVSTNNLNYITQEAVSLPASEFTGGGSCKTPTKDVDVLAQNPGDQYNVAGGRTFAVSGYSSISGSNSAAFSGGTSKIVKVVSQQDVDNAKQKVSDRIGNAAKDELKKKLEDQGYYAILESFNTSAPNAISSPNVGEEAAEVTVSVTTTSTMLGVNKDNLKELVEAEIGKDIDTSKQQILDNGLDKATSQIGDKRPNGDTVVKFQVTATAGVKQDEEAIKQEIKGKKKNETRDLILVRPGVKEVTVNYSPFWVSKTPKKTSKITLVFEKNQGNDGSQ